MIVYKQIDSAKKNFANKNFLLKISFFYKKVLANENNMWQNIIIKVMILVSSVGRALGC